MFRRFYASIGIRQAAVLLLLAALLTGPMNAQAVLQEDEKNRRLRELVEDFKRKLNGPPPEPAPQPGRHDQPSPPRTARREGRRPNAKPKRKDAGPNRAGQSAPVAAPTPPVVANNEAPRGEANPPSDKSQVPAATPGASQVDSEQAPSPILIEAPAAGVSRWRLAGIFLSLLLLLGLLALVPSGAGLIEGWKRRRSLRRSMVTLDQNSSLIGEACPNEGHELGGSRRFRPGDVAVICPGCGTAHHLGCWQLAKDRCWNRHCGHELSTPPAH